MVYDPQEDLIALAKIKAAQDALAKEKSEVETRLLKELVSKGIKTLDVILTDSVEVKGTVVQPERTTIDADGLERDLTKKQWEAVSKRVMDKELLEAAVVQNIVDINVVQAHSETKPTKAFVKVTISGKPSPNGIVFNDNKVNITSSNGAVKPAARKRVAKPKAGK